MYVTRADDWNMAQPDFWAGLACVGALGLVTGSAASHRSYASAGALVGFMVLVKPHYVLTAIPLVAAAWSRYGFSRQSISLVAATAGGTITVLVLAVAALASVGALEAMLGTMVQFNLQHHVGRLEMTLSEVVGMVLSDFVSIWRFGRPLLAGVGLVALYARCGWPVVAPLLAMLVVTYVVGVVQLKWYRYHFYPLDLVMTIPCAYALIAVAREVVRAPAGRDLRQAALMSAIVAGLFLHMMRFPAEHLTESTVYQWKRVAGLSGPPASGQRLQS